jgi:putative DNA primase/helicase
MQEGKRLKPPLDQQLLAWAHKEKRTLKHKNTITAIENLARSNSASAVNPEDFDLDPLLLGTPGGTVDLRTGKLRPAAREDLITKLTAYSPAEAGTVPERWLNFLNRIFAGDQELIDFMQLAAAYALTGLTTEHKFLFLYGRGRNGKSVFLNTLSKIWGKYSWHAPADLFLASQSQQHPTGLAGLRSARLVVGSEIPKGKTWDEAKLKDLTGGDRLSARYMHGNFFTFDPQLTLMIAGNDKPKLAGVDTAIRSRMVLVPFNVRIPDIEIDPSLQEKLMSEAPAILRWAIEGVLQWQLHGLNVPASVRAASEEYLNEEDLLKNFLDEKTSNGPKFRVGATEIYECFEAWCRVEGVPILSRKDFIREMASHSHVHCRSSSFNVYRGLGLRQP